MSGIDDIGGQVYPQGEHDSYNRGVFQTRNGEFYHFLLGKLASSAASIEPLKNGNSMCEIFGAYGWSEGLRLEKYLTDHFLVRGVNHYVPHAFSPKEFPDPDCPPHFYANGHNPEYRHFGCLMKYMNRVCELISNGKHVCPVAILYHGEGQWTGKHMADEEIGIMLVENQIEYDIIPQDVFRSPSEFKMTFSDGYLNINKQKYSVLIVPYSEYITQEFAEKIAGLIHASVSVIFIDDFPKGICNFDSNDSIIKDIRNLSKVVKKDDLINHLKSLNGILDLKINPANNYLRFIHYIHENEKTSIYMIVNEGTEIYRGNVNFSFLQDDSTNSSHYIYDAWNNCLLNAEIESNSLNVSIEPLKSFIVVFDKNNNKKFETKEIIYSSIDELNKKSKETIEFKNQWKRSICSSIDYPHFKDEKIINLPDSLEKENPEFSGFIKYENSIKLTKDFKKLILNITDAYEGVEVFVNDKSLGIQIVPNFIFDISDEIVEGENKIRIEVATTLERELSKIPQKLGPPKAEPKNPSGINGMVRIIKF